MKSVLISIQPKWCEKIADRGKTIEVRKSAPKCDVPFKCYIYETKGQYIKFIRGALTKYGYGCGKVIGEFMCDKVFQWNCKKYLECDGTVIYRYFPLKPDLDKSCLTFGQFHDYGCGKTLYGWHISDLKIYDKPRELNEFISPSKAKNCVDYCLNGICSNLGYEELCGAIRRCEYKKLTRPPQSWCYVEVENAEDKG